MKTRTVIIPAGRQQARPVTVHYCPSLIAHPLSMWVKKLHCGARILAVDVAYGDGAGVLHWFLGVDQRYRIFSHN